MTLTHDMQATLDVARDALAEGAYGVSLFPRNDAHFRSDNTVHVHFSPLPGEAEARETLGRLSCGEPTRTDETDYPRAYLRAVAVRAGVETWVQIDIQPGETVEATE